MAHFAQLDDNNVVLAIHVVNNDVITVNGSESEEVGITFLTNLFPNTNWKQTSYNGTFRKNYAAIDDIYDENRDAFISPKPFASWLLNENTCQWEAPTPQPNDGKYYFWNEDKLKWVEISLSE
jgi:hypothetical protein